MSGSGTKRGFVAFRTPSMKLDLLGQPLKNDKGARRRPRRLVVERIKKPRSGQKLLLAKLRKANGSTE